MKRIVLTLAGLLLCSMALLAQRPANYVFKGTASCWLGSDSTAPVTCTINTTSGNVTFKSDGNGRHVGPFTWKGNMPAVKNADITMPGIPWAFQLTEWSDMTIGTRERVNGKMVDKQERLTSTRRAVNNTAPVQGINYDGKEITLEIRIPYNIPGQNDAVGVNFTVKLDLTSKQTGETHTTRSSDDYPGTVPMPTGTNDPVHINYDNGISIGSLGNVPTQAREVRASVGGVAFALARGYSARKQDNLGGGESIRVTRDGSNDFLYAEVQKEGLSNVRNLSSDQVADLLAVRVQYLNTVMPGVRMTEEPKIYFDDNSDGYYHQHAYSYGKGKDSQGRNVQVYSEATLVNKKMITAGVAVAANKDELNALTDIYADVVSAAAGK